MRSRVPRPAIGPYVRLCSARCGYDDPQSPTVRLEIHCATIVGSARSCLDRREARIGQKNGLVRQWARRGTRPRQPADQRYDNAYLFGAICPARGVGAALALPYADTDMMQLHLDEISSNVAKGAHAVVLLDRAGWHITSKLDMPDNITPISCLPAPRS